MDIVDSRSFNLNTIMDPTSFRADADRSEKDLLLDNFKDLKINKSGASSVLEQSLESDLLLTSKDESHYSINEKNNS